MSAAHPAGAQRGRSLPWRFVPAARRPTEGTPAGLRHSHGQGKAAEALMRRGARFHIGPPRTTPNSRFGRTKGDVVFVTWARASSRQPPGRRPPRGRPTRLCDSAYGPKWNLWLPVLLGAAPACGPALAPGPELSLDPPRWIKAKCVVGVCLSGIAVGARTSVYGRCQNRRRRRIPPRRFGWGSLVSWTASRRPSRFRFWSISAGE